MTAKERFCEMIEKMLEPPKELILNEDKWVEVWDLRNRISGKYNIPWRF